MSNQAATLALRERRNVVRSLYELEVLAQRLRSLLEDPDQTLADTQELFIDLVAEARNIDFTVERWLAFMEVSDDQQ